MNFVAKIGIRKCYEIEKGENTVDKARCIVHGSDSGGFEERVEIFFRDGELTEGFECEVKISLTLVAAKDDTPAYLHLFLISVV